MSHRTDLTIERLDEGTAGRHAAARNGVLVRGRVQDGRLDDVMARVGGRLAENNLPTDDVIDLDRLFVFLGWL